MSFTIDISVIALVSYYNYNDDASTWDNSDGSEHMVCFFILFITLFY